MFKLLSSAGSFFFSCDGGLPRAPLFPRTSRLITTCDYIFRLPSIAIKKQKDDCIALIVSHLSWRDFQRWERVQAQRYYFEVFYFFEYFQYFFFYFIEILKTKTKRARDKNWDGKKKRRNNRRQSAPMLLRVCTSMCKMGEDAS